MERRKDEKSTGPQQHLRKHAEVWQDRLRRVLGPIDHAGADGGGAAVAQLSESGRRAKFPWRQLSRTAVAARKCTLFRASDLF